MPNLPNTRGVISGANAPLPPNGFAPPDMPRAPATPLAPNEPPDASEGPMIPGPFHADAGYLVVAVSTASGAIPLENALVLISAVQPNGMSELIYTTRTNKSGRTAKLPLPAPPRSNSLTPGTQDPYAKYSVSVELNGYQPVISRNLSVFADVVATLPISMVPLTAAPTSSLPPMRITVPEHSLYPKE